MSHANAPWTYFVKLTSSENHRGFTIYEMGIKRKTIADIFAIDPNGKEGEANARLIAAAPELLDALTRLVACYASSNSPNIRASCWKQAHIAIAKATGEKA